MVNHFPTLYQDKYYVYSHNDPETEEVLYIGYGSSHRAWVFNAIVYRQKEHLKYLKYLESNGFLPCDWVRIEMSHLSKEDAMALEKDLIKHYNPRFNIHKGLGSLTDKNKIKKARILRKKGLSYSKIAKKMKLKSDMSAWRYVNNDHK